MERRPNLNDATHYALRLPLMLSVCGIFKSVDRHTEFTSTGFTGAGFTIAGFITHW